MSNTLQIGSRWLRRSLAATLFVLASAASATSAEAQVVRNFSIRFETRTNGDIYQIGNTAMTCATSATCISARAGIGPTVNNNNFSMVRVDVDSDGTTLTSSSADLTLTNDQTVLFAALFWGGRSTAVERYDVKLETPASGGYIDLTATQQDVDITGERYSGFVDVTALVQAAGNGTYTVADVATTTGTDRHAGWTIVMVVEDPNQPLRSLQVYDGYARVSSANSATMTATGLIVPPAGPVTTLMGTVVYEGDLGTTGDDYRLNGTPIGDALNPTNNYHNSSITFKGSRLTAKNPDYSNQLGFDATWVDVSPFSAIPNGSTTATIDLSTSGDVYFPAAVTFATDLFSPSIEPTFTKNVTDVDGGTVLPGDTLEYSMSFSNTGDDAAINVVLLDTIPATSSFVAGSLEITSGANAGVLTDAPGDDQADFDGTVTPNGAVVFRLGTSADGATGGRIGPAESTAIRFRVVVDPGAADGTDVTNRAHVGFDGETSGRTGLSASSTDAIATVVFQADLAVALAGPDSAMIGDTLLYEIVTSNGGPSSAADVVVAHVIPAGLTFFSANRGGLESGGTVTWPSLGTLAAAASVTDTVRLVATTLGTQNNVASAVTSTIDPVAANSDGSDAASQQETLVFRDTDGDGIADASDLDADNDGVPDSAEGGEGIDSDGDGLPDRRDVDSDGDGIPDLVEAGGTDADGDGRLDTFTDANDDGLDDTLAGTPLPDPDSDSDTLEDRVDIDSDGDGVTDAIEAQAEGAFRAPAGADVDGDGLDDEYDPSEGGTAIALANTDSASGDVVPDFLDDDADGDLVPDSIEVHDANSDGTPDRVAGGTDADGDGLDDVFDADQGGTAAPLQDTDSDTTRDFRDTDDDGDGIDTDAEDADSNGDPTNDDDDGDGTPDYLDDDDTDADGVPDTADGDDDGDGVPDAAEGDGAVDTDSDGVPDSRDVDSDADGVTDAIEAQAEGAFRAPSGTDADGDGLDDEYDPSEGGTAIVLANTDSGSGDIVPDFRDDDADGDLVPDSIEAHDANADGVPDRVAGGTDADGDGLDDVFDADQGGTAAPLQDTDADGTRDFRDTDDDDDGIDTDAEDDNANGDPTDDDDDGDGTPDYLDDDDTDADGVPDASDGDDDGDGVPDAAEGDGAVDTDGDGVPDSRDPDSDADGIVDLVEAGGTDANGDGRVDGFVDVNGDGVDDNLAATPLPDPDTDGTGGPDRRDADADGDGVPDNIEAQAEGAFRAPSGNDVDADGLDDEYDPNQGGTAITPVNTDSASGDIDADYVDDDADGDLVPDSIEAHDANSDGVPDRVAGGTDADADGVDDVFDADQGGTAAPLQNTDGDGTRDFRDADDDGDGVQTGAEDANGNSDPTDDDDDGDGTPDYLDADDTDGDGVPDSADGDDDGDGIADVAEGDGAVDSDGDGVPDSRDADADGDGIPDSVEAQAEGSFRAPAGADVDGDGIDDEYDPSEGGTAITLANTDAGSGDTTPDHLDDDSDGDGVDDVIEGHDANGDGQPDRVPGGTDADGDGLDDVFDADQGGTAAPLQDTDTDGTRDFRDVDDDGDGVDTSAEDGNGNGDPTDDDDDGDGTPDYLDDDDTDGDGVPDNVDGDDDGDGLDDTVEDDGAVDTDGDGQPDSRDVDADGDGVTDGIEAQPEGAFRAPSGTDADGDGIDDEYDPSEGGTAITPVNTDGASGDTDPDFRDIDADGDLVADSVEAHDADGDGQPDRVAGGADVDGDGLDDVFDADQGGTAAPLPDAGGAADRDWRDADDDGDGVPTAAEDTNGNGDPTDDDDDGDGVPDYLDADDTDGDGVPDNLDADADGDGLPDALEGDETVDTDGDGIPDRRDADSDGDGIPDRVEAQPQGAFVPPTGTDTDGDGIDDAYDADDGGTPITPANTDSATGDTTPDYLDDDSDGDGVPDATEAHDGEPNGQPDRAPTGSDTDGDGIDDAYDPDNGGVAPVQGDTDSDGTPDWRDADDDGDGVATSAEDTDGNGDPADDDSDSDGVPDYLDADDSDGDGVPDSLDGDDDGDGIPDTVEGDGAVDSDGDGIPDSRDLDSDGDGILDNVEAQDANAYVPPTGSDGDGDGIDDAYDPDDGGTAIVPVNTDSGSGGTTPDYLDTDSDGDGVPDASEGHDADGDGQPDRAATGTDTDGDGLDDAFDPDDGGTPAVSSDTDGDGVPDWQDDDDDGDGVGTASEDTNGNGDPTDDDADGDGVPDYLDGDDADQDGVPDSIDEDDDGDGLPDALEGDGSLDSDGDGVPDSRDTDSDGDGIPDSIEAQDVTTATPPTGTDTDGDGIDDAYDADNGGTPIVPANGDAGTGDTTPDYLDTDSDGDGVPDSTEGHDADGDGQPDRMPTGSDADGDGLDDAFDPDSGGVPPVVADTDGDGLPDYADPDDDGDGIDTALEDTNGNGDPTDDDADGDGIPDYIDSQDTDRDGVPDSVDGDDDGDGLPDALEGDGAVDTDGDGIPDSLDADSDGDGISDNVEAQASDAFVAPTGVDTDGDGVDDAYDADSGGTPIVPLNSDADRGDTTPDHLDDDSDGDGVPDLTEGHDADMDGQPDVTPTGGDADGDGVDDAFDADAGGTPAVTPDTDSDGTPDWRDQDDDGDNDVTLAEDANGNGDPTDDDSDSDGTPDYLDLPDVDLAARKAAVGDFLAGESAVFRIVVDNVGAGRSYDTITVVDTLPAGLTYVGFTGAGWNVGTTGQEVTATHPGPVEPGDSLALELRVDLAADLNGTITNTASVSTAGDPSSNNNNNGTSAPVSIVSASELVLDKRSTKFEAEIGDMVGYTLRVGNVGGGLLNDVVVVDEPPAGFSYLEGSTTIDQVEAPDPVAGSGGVLTFDIGELAPDETVVVSYSLRVGVGSQLGDGVNRALARSSSTGTVSTQAAAEVRVRAGVFSDEAYLAGTVYANRDTAIAQHEGDPGIPGVRVYLQDGTSAITDAEGKYSFFGLRPRLYVVRVDQSTLPEGARLGAITNRHSDDGRTLAVELLRGELHRADFAETSRSAAVMRDVEARRSQMGAPRQMFGDGSATPVGDGVAGAMRSFPMDEEVELSPAVSGLPAGPGDAVFRWQGGVVESGVRAGLGDGAVPADGQTIVPIRIRAADDATGGTVPVGSTVTLEASRGAWVTPDADAVAPGHQVPVSNGEVEARLRAPVGSGPATVRVSRTVQRAGEEITEQDEGTIDFVRRDRPMLVTGLVEGRIDFRSLAGGELLTGASRDRFDDALESISVGEESDEWTGGVRAAAFATGEIAQGTNVTIRFDTEVDPRSRFFNDIRPDELYNVYGDASSRLFEAQSKGRVYALVERGPSLFQYGDFTTVGLGGTSNTLGRYSRTLNGGLYHFQNDWTSIDAFVSHDRFRQVVDELPGRGISGPYELSRADALLNSERIEIVTRDRNQPAVILDVEPMQRFTDYTIEPFTGRLVFRRPIPSIDAELNPISIRITYELEQGGDQFVTYGAAARVAASDRIAIGGSVVRDDNPLGSYGLSSANTDIDLGAGTTLAAEVAVSDSADAPSGVAYRVEVKHASRRLEARGFVQDSDTSFLNPSAGIGIGRREIGASARGILNEKTQLFAEGLRTESRVTSGFIQGLTFGLERKIVDAISVEAGYRTANQDGAAPAGGSATAPVDVDAMRFKVTGRLAEDASLFTEYEQDLGNADMKRVEVGGDLRLFDRARLYARHELLSSFAGPYALNGQDRLNQTVFGVSADYMAGSRVYSEYRARDAFSGRQAHAAIGLRNEWKVGEGLGLGAGLERISALTESTTIEESFSLSGSVEYTGSPLWKGTLRGEYRDAESQDQLFGTAGFARKLNRDWALLAQSAWSHIFDGATYGRTRTGVAYRSTETNKWNVLARYEHKLDEGGTVPGAAESVGARSRTAHILSAHSSMSPNASWIVALQAASKFSDETMNGVTLNESAHLLSTRVTHDITRGWDVGLMGRTLFSGDFDEQQYGLGLEIGRRLRDNFRVAVGYNLFGFQDEDLTEDLPTDHGFFVDIGLAFDESLFGLGREDGGG